MPNMNMGSMPLMPGMVTPEQMQALSKATGRAFDHLFLTGMIQHHTGALVMVQDLFDTPGAGQDAVLFDFASDVDNTQRAEIIIMQDMLKEKKMISEGTPRLSRRAAAIRALTVCLSLTRLSSGALRRPDRPAQIHRLYQLRGHPPTIPG